MIRASNVAESDRLLTGHFFENDDYHIHRAQGTRDELLIYTVAGSGRFGHRGGYHFTQPGELILLRKDTPHDYATAPSAGHWELLWTHFHPRVHWFDWWQYPSVTSGMLSVQTAGVQSERIKAALLEMHHLATGGETHREQRAMNALERVWLECLPPEFETQLDERIARGVRLIRTNTLHPLKLPDLAAQCHLSLSRFSHLFTQQVGQSPQQFLESTRLNRAAQLLNATSKTISSIAFEVGFGDPLYFSRRFRAMYGRSPREYRERS